MFGDITGCSKMYWELRKKKITGGWRKLQREKLHKYDLHVAYLGGFKENRLGGT